MDSPDIVVAELNDFTHNGIIVRIRLFLPLNPMPSTVCVKR